VISRVSQMALSAFGLLVLVGSGFALRATPADSPDALPGTASISGTVTSEKEFKGAKVYATNLEKNVVFMVYTAGGHYQFVNLFPGTYEVRVEKNGFDSEGPKKVSVSSSGDVKADFSLRAGKYIPNVRVQVEYPIAKALPYDEVYPPGPGREIAQNCLVCHGPDWLSTRQFSAEQWNTAIDDMIRRANVSVPGSFSASERRTLVDYLTQNFGPDSEPRRVAQPEMAVDEAALSKAMYVEYHLPPLAKNQMAADAHSAEEGDAPAAACANCGGRRLHDPHIGNDGDVWYADQLGDVIGRVDPRTATFKDYPIPDPTAVPHGLTMDRAGIIWFTSATALGRLDPETGKMKLYKNPDFRSGGNTPIVDSKGNVWYTGGASGSYLAKWDHATDKVTFYKTPTFEPQPYGMVHDKNDNLWFALLARCKVVKFDQQTEQFIEYSPPNSDRPCTIRRLSFDHDGMLWYGLAGKVDGFQKIGKLDTQTGKIIEYTMPYLFTYPYDIQPDPENNMWITDAGEGGALVKFDRKTEKFIYYPMPQLTDMPKLEVSRAGSIWYTTRSGDPKTMAIGVLFPDKTKIKSYAAYNP